MKTIKENTEKKIYFSPQIERIKLDNELSLTMESAPVDPEDYSKLSPEYFNSDSFKTNFG